MVVVLLDTDMMVHTGLTQVHLHKASTVWQRSLLRLLSPLVEQRSSESLVVRVPHQDTISREQQGLSGLVYLWVNLLLSQSTVANMLQVFYVVTVTLVTILVPSDDPNLLGGTNVNASPLVIAVKRAGIKTLPDILNAIILICVMSVGTSSLYAASRMLMYLSSVKMAPKIFSRTDRAGRPITALLLTSVVGIGLSFLNVSNTGAVVFGWFSSLSGTAFFIFWLDIFLCNWRWRAAQKAQGVNMIGERFAYTQWGYPYAPIAGFILVFFMLVCNGYTSIWPLAGSPNATNFFANYLGVPVFIAMWAGWKLWSRTWWLCIKSSDVDLEVDRRYLSDHPEEEKFLEDYATLPKWKRFLSYVNF